MFNNGRAISKGYVFQEKEMQISLLVLSQQDAETRLCFCFTPPSTHTTTHTKSTAKISGHMLAVRGECLNRCLMRKIILLKKLNLFIPNFSTDKKNTQH